MAKAPNIAVFGASGLIGEAVSLALIEQGFAVTPIARRFTASQRAGFGPVAIECAVMTFDVAGLCGLLAESNIDIAVNCVGVLRGGGYEVHEDFAKRLLAALAMRGNSLLIQISIPGLDEGDSTFFSRTKRKAERIIAESLVPSVILRPGFVIAPVAYGGSALMRAMAMTFFDFPQTEASRPFMITAVSDIVRTIVFVAQRWQSGEREWKRIWDVMTSSPSSVSDVLNAFRTHFGGPQWRIALPSAAIVIGAVLGDFAFLLGWSSPIGRTSLAEMRRGIVGDPQAWVAEAGIEPAALATALREAPATIQEKWFARLYFLKPLIVAVLVIFWCVSGLIALTAAFDAATAILTAHNFSLPSGRAVTFVSSSADIAVGTMIAFRKTCRTGLITGIFVSLFYMAGAAMLTPEMWLEPLGALVKTFPSIVLSVVLLGILDDR